jgi:hypothetical protein
MDHIRHPYATRAPASGSSNMEQACTWLRGMHPRYNAPILSTHQLLPSTETSHREPCARSLQGDAADYMRELAASAPGSVAQVYIDAFDGQDLVPRQLCTAGLPFMAHLAAALHPAHGSLLINLHSEGTGGLAPADKLRIMMGARTGQPCSAERHMLPAVSAHSM